LPFFAAMYSAFQLAVKYCTYYLTASNGKGHGIHSPFVFDFITNVLNDEGNFYCYGPIESLRSQLLQDQTMLTIEDFGAGSRTAATKQRSVASIAHAALKPKKFSQLLFRIANYYQPKTILELGTSLGITTAYLASANSNATTVTMEGASSVAANAQRVFDALSLKQVSIVEGNFDHTLQPTLDKLQQLDLVYVDGNHRLEPTLRYFNQIMPYTHDTTILIFDDIHWSKEMEQAWETIKSDPRVLLSVDLFFIGLVFFRKDFKVKQHFAIRF
jgi:predicted O-methyltransferase YrrM